jgi:hypothetical protein
MTGNLSLIPVNQISQARWSSLKGRQTRRQNPAAIVNNLLQSGYQLTTDSYFSNQAY